MNERIQELSEQAEEYADRWFRGEPTWSEAFESKFAELIIMECAGVTLDYKNNDYYTGWCDHSAEILNRFGITDA